MSNQCYRLGERLTLRVALIFIATLACSAVSAQSIGSQAGNIPFNQAWQCPAGTTELNDYFVAPGYVTLVELWGIN